MHGLTLIVLVVVTATVTIPVEHFVRRRWGGASVDPFVDAEVGARRRNRRDTQRIEWLSTHPATVSCSPIGDDGWVMWQVGDGPQRTTLRQAIDFAMDKNGDWTNEPPANDEPT